MTCKSSYYIVVNQNHLVTNLPKTSISRFKTYINWLLEAERGDKLYKFSILIESPKGTPLSDINQIVFLVIVLFRCQPPLQQELRHQILKFGI